MNKQRLLNSRVVKHNLLVAILALVSLIFNVSASFSAPTFAGPGITAPNPCIDINTTYVVSPTCQGGQITSVTLPFPGDGTIISITAGPNGSVTVVIKWSCQSLGFGRINATERCPIFNPTTQETTFQDNPGSVTAFVDYPGNTVPHPSGSISGQTEIPCCSSGPGYTFQYCYTGPTCFTKFRWSVPNGWTIIGPSNGNCINVQAPSSGSGVISVKFTDNCNTNSPFVAASIDVSVKKLPNQLGQINAVTIPYCCADNLTYTVPEADCAVSYTWTFPSGWTVNGSANGNTVNVSPSSTSPTGIITVKANDACDNSTAIRTYNIYRQFAPLYIFPVNENGCVCANSTATFRVEGLCDDQSTFDWTVPTSWTLVSQTGNTATFNTGNSYPDDPWEDPYLTGLKATVHTPCGDVDAQYWDGEWITTAPLAPTLNQPSNDAHIVGTPAVGQTGECNFDHFEWKYDGVYQSELDGWTNVPPINGQICARSINICGQASEWACLTTTMKIASQFGESDPVYIEQSKFEKLLKIEPNPTSSLLRVTLPENNGVTSIKLVSISGTVVKDVPISKGELRINVSDMSSGTYYLRIQTNSFMVLRDIKIVR